MAYVVNGQDDENKNNVAVNGGGSSVHLAPSSGVGAVGAGAGTSNNGQGAGGGSFATINQYLNANQDQAQPLANQLTTGINKQYDTLSGQNQQVTSDLQNQVNAGSTKQNNQILSQEAANPVSFASDPNNVNAFQGQLNAKYTGPQSAEGTDAFTKQQAALNSAISQGKSATQTEAGRQGLLQNVEKNPTNGVTSLNSAILSQNPNSQSQIEHAYDPFSNLVGSLDSSGQQVDQSIAGAKTEAQNASSAANKAIADQTQSLNANVGKEQSALQDQYNGYNASSAALASQLQSGKLPAGYGVDQGLNDFMTNEISPWQTGAGLAPLTYNFSNIIPQLQQANAPTLAQAATPSDYSTLGALQSLTGGSINSPLTGLDQAQSGTYKLPTIPDVDNKGIANDILDSLQAEPGNLTGNQPAWYKFINLMNSLTNYTGATNKPLSPTGSGPGSPTTIIK